jgi:alkyl hydroperoxide reductase subunit AhpC
MDSVQFQGRWTVLCFVPGLGLIEALFLNRQVEAFAQKGASLLAVSPEDAPFHHPWVSQISTVRVPILADPLGLVRRRYGITQAYAPGRCRSFLLDPDGLLRFHLVHDLSSRGMGALLEIIGTCQSQEAQPAVEHY